MVENVVKTFKLNYDGTFDEITYENIKNVFTIVNILAIYIQNKKIMYIWIGRSATQALKNHVARIREKIKEEFPDYRIIRNITFDMRSEPYEFFKNLEMTKEDLFQQIEYQEKVILPILDKIKDFKVKSNKFIEVEDYEKAIDSSKKIVKLAQKIEDDAQVTEYKNLILDLTKKYKMKKILGDIESEIKQVKKKFIVYTRTKDFLQAHQIVEEFVKKYEDLCDLSKIVSVQDLISEEKKVWAAEQDKLSKKLVRLETDYTLSLKRSEFTEAKEIITQAKELLSKLINGEIQKKWGKLEEKLLKATYRDDLIDKVEDFLKESIELKRTYQFGVLKQKLDELLNQVIKEDIKKYQKALNSLKEEVITAEETHTKTTTKISDLKKKIEVNKKNNLLEDNIKDCEEILKLANSINNNKIIGKYLELLEKIKKKIKERKEFENIQINLKEELANLENEFNSSLNIMEIKNLRGIFKKVELLLSKLEDDEIKKKWESFNIKFLVAKQLLEDIETLSNKGIKALNKGTYSKSLEFFEKIIYQLQEYKS